MRVGADKETINVSRRNVANHVYDGMKELVSVQRHLILA